MVIKNNHLDKTGGVNKNVTNRQHMSTKMLTVLTVKNSSLSTNRTLETRANTASSRCVDEIDVVDSRIATSLHSLFKATH